MPKANPETFRGSYPLSFKLKHIGIDHPAAQNLNPPRLLARTARLRPALPAPAANEAGNEHLCARLGKRKKRRTETGLDARTKKFLHGMIKRPLQVTECNVGIHREPLDLMKHRRMARVRRIVAMHRPRNHNPN